MIEPSPPQDSGNDGRPAAGRRDLPPLYSTSINPHLADFVESHRSAGQREVVGPFVGHLATDERHAVYSFHPYHTKVPPSIIASLIEHYTLPGDLVLDVFCGSGMTGVAARDAGRHAVLVDLSPIATFISSVNTRSNNWESALARIHDALERSEKLLGWVYEVEEGVQANYFVWSDTFSCTVCSAQFPFFPHGVLHHGNKVETRKEFPCPACGAALNVRRVKRLLRDGVKQKELVWVNAGTGAGRVNRAARASDLARASEAMLLQRAPHPRQEIDPRGYSAKLAQLGDKGITDVSRLLSERNLVVYADLWKRLDADDVEPDVRNLCLAAMTSIFTVVSERQGYFGGGGGMSGNLYMPIVRMEKNVYQTLRRKLSRLRLAEQAKVFAHTDVAISTQSATDLTQLPDNCVDYVYTDPPFGNNIIYSEVNLALEAWLGVLTDAGEEAVVDASRERSLDDYQRLMSEAFAECYRVLKPGRWMSVEFHNTAPEVWSAIQSALESVGFGIGAVTTLDKGTTTILGDIRPNSAKHDLIISAFKHERAVPGRKINRAAPALADLRDEIVALLNEVPTARPQEVRHHVFSRLVALHLERGWRVGFSSKELYDHLESIVNRQGNKVHNASSSTPEQETLF